MTHRDIIIQTGHRREGCTLAPLTGPLSLGTGPNKPQVTPSLAALSLTHRSACSPHPSAQLLLCTAQRTHANTHTCPGLVGSPYLNIFTHHITTQHMALCTSMIGGTWSNTHSHRLNFWVNRQPVSPPAGPPACPQHRHTIKRVMST